MTPIYNPVSVPPGPQRLLQPLLVLATAVLVLTGCSGEERVTTNTVLARTNCKGVSAGLQLVSLADVAAYRGTELLTNTTTASETEGDLPLFVALSRGEQLTRGFELHLTDQALVVQGSNTTDGAQLMIPVHWSEPDPNEAQPKEMMHPCLVVSVPDRNWASIEAIDQNGETVGRLLE